MKIAIPDAPHLSPLTANAQAVCDEMGWELVVVPEDRAATMLINHLVDMALVGAVLWLILRQSQVRPAS